MSGVKIRFIEAGYTQHLEAIALRGGRFAKIRFPASVAVIEHPKRGIFLFDTGYSQRFHEQTRHFPNRFYSLITPVTIPPEQTAAAQIRSWGIPAGDVRGVVLSHFHADHVAGASDFVKAKYLYRKSAYDAVKNLSAWGGVKAGFLRGLLPADFEARSQALTDDQFTARFASGTAEASVFRTGYDLFGDGSVVAVDLPGHAVGQLGLYVQAGDGRRYLLAADACWDQRSYQELRPPHSITKLLFSDWDQYMGTLSKLNQLSKAAPEIKIVPCHCEKTLEGLHDHATHSAAE